MVRTRGSRFQSVQLDSFRTVSSRLPERLFHVSAFTVTGTVSPLSASMSSRRRSARKDWRHRVLQRRPHQTTMYSATSDGLTKARTLASICFEQVYFRSPFHPVNHPPGLRLELLSSYKNGAKSVIEGPIQSIEINYEVNTTRTPWAFTFVHLGVLRETQLLRTCQALLAGKEGSNSKTMLDRNC